MALDTCFPAGMTVKVTTAAIKAAVIAAWMPESSAMDGKVKNKLIPQNIVLIDNNGINIKSMRSPDLYQIPECNSAV